MESRAAQPQTQQKSAAFFAQGRADLRAATQPDPSEARGSPKPKSFYKFCKQRKPV